MRIYTNLKTAVRETERDLFEMGIDVHPQTMQDKDVIDDPAYMTKELQAYAFQVVGCKYDQDEADSIVRYLFGDKKAPDINAYLAAEFIDRTNEQGPRNPGNAYQHRLDLWQEFLHNGKFSYTYSERLYPQLRRIHEELMRNPETRQAIVNVHTNIAPIQEVLTRNMPNQSGNQVLKSADMANMGGTGRIPCSMYYQFMRRKGVMDMVYTMRSCDFLTHFGIDLILAIRLQSWMATLCRVDPGRFTYFAGSLHAYKKDMAVRGIF